MQNLKSPVTFIILFSVLAAFTGGAIFLFTAGQSIGQSLFGRSFAEKQLKEYVSSVLREEVYGVRCQAVDTDRNGYVSCDYTISSERGVTRSVECSVWSLNGFLNRGCKTRFPNFQPR
jgi:hypothetical protein